MSAVKYCRDCKWSADGYAGIVCTHDAGWKCEKCSNYRSGTGQWACIKGGACAEYVALAPLGSGGPSPLTEQRVREIVREELRSNDQSGEVAATLNDAEGRTPCAPSTSPDPYAEQLVERLLATRWDKDNCPRMNSERNCSVGLALEAAACIVALQERCAELEKP